MNNPDSIDVVRRFNRSYTRRLGLLGESLLDSGFSLAEARILFELADNGPIGASRLAEGLVLDGGYLSRLLKGLRRRGLVEAARSPADLRTRWLSLSAAGRDAYERLKAASRAQIADLLEPLPADQRAELVGAMARIEQLLGPAAPERPALVLRPPRIGDMGWMVQRQAQLYAREYGWDERFEGLLARIAAEFVERFDARRERCWVAEIDGQAVGSVLVVREDEYTARLRMLFVEASARGQGVGRRLVGECIAFARLSGYASMVLWTNDILAAARRLYEAAGFRMVREEAHHSFGKDLVGQHWVLDLAGE